MTDRELVQKVKALLDVGGCVAIDKDRTQPVKLREMHAAINALKEAIEFDGLSVWGQELPGVVEIIKKAKSLIAVSCYVVIDTDITQPLMIKELHVAFGALVDAIRERSK